MSSMSNQAAVHTRTHMREEVLVVTLEGVVERRHVGAHPGLLLSAAGAPLACRFGACCQWLLLLLLLQTQGLEGE